MKKTLLSFVAAFFVLLLVGCGKSNKLIGKWTGKTNDGLKTTWVFEKKDVVKYENEFGIKSNGTYKITDNIVTISLESWSNPIDYEFDIHDGKLYLTAQNKYSPSYDGLTKSK